MLLFQHDFIHNIVDHKVALVSANTEVVRVLAPWMARNVDFVWVFNYKSAHFLKLWITLCVQYFLADVNFSVLQETIRAGKRQG